MCLAFIEVFIVHADDSINLEANTSRKSEGISDSSESEGPDEEEVEDEAEWEDDLDDLNEDETT